MRLLILVLVTYLSVLAYRVALEELPMDYYGIVEMFSKESGIDPFMVMAVMKAESDFEEDAVSPAGAVGLMQLMPKTASWIAPHLDPEDPVQNIKIGVVYLRHLIDLYDGDVEKALMAYNVGPRSLKDGMNVETAKRYLGRVKLFWFLYEFTYRVLF